MFSFQDLTEYCPAPYKKRVPFNVEVKKSSDKPARPNRDLSRVVIDEKSKPKISSSDRTIRSEDVNIRKRVNPESVKGRLTDDMNGIYNSEIETQARKLTMIGEKVITKLFKVEVPDKDDIDYINKRSKLISQGMTKEQADSWLKENFREQFKVKEPIDITRMNFSPPLMIDIAKQFLVSTTPQTVEDAAITQTSLNNTLLRNDLSVDSMVGVIDILKKNPHLRTGLTLNTPMRPLAILSNFVVGSPIDEIDSKPQEMPIGAELDKDLVDGDLLDALHDEILAASSQVSDVIEEEKKKDDNTESLEDFLARTSSNIPEIPLEEKVEIEEEEKHDFPFMPKPSDVSPPPPSPTEKPALLFNPEMLMKKKEQIAAVKTLQAAIRAMIATQSDGEAKKALIDASNVVKKEKHPIVKGIVLSDLLNIKKGLKSKEDRDKILDAPKTPELTDVQKKLTELKKASDRPEIKKPVVVNDMSDMVKAMRERSASIRSAIAPEKEKSAEELAEEKEFEEEEPKKEEKPKEALMAFSSESDLVEHIKDKKVGVNKLKELVSSFNRLLKNFKPELQKEKKIKTSDITLKNLDSIKMELIDNIEYTKILDVLFGKEPTPKLLPPETQKMGDGMKKSKKKMKKSKQMRKPSKWILEIKDIMKKEGLTYGQGMKRASEERKKKK